MDITSHPRAQETVETAWRDELFWARGCKELVSGCKTSFLRHGMRSFVMERSDQFKPACFEILRLALHYYFPIPVHLRRLTNNTRLTATQSASVSTIILSTLKIPHTNVHR